MSESESPKKINPIGIPVQNQDWILHWAQKKSILFCRSNRNQRPVNDSSALIWSLCNGKRSINEIISNLETLYPDNLEEVTKDFEMILAEFHENALISGNIYIYIADKPAATPGGPKRKLCIGMATYDDYDGTYFSVQAIRMYHPEVTELTEILVIDNNPVGLSAKPLKKLDGHVENYRYVPYDHKTSTAVRDIVFREANADYVMCIDCHVFIVPGAIKKLIDYFDAHQDTNDLIQGPMLSDNLKNFKTHLNPEWRGGMYGIWSHDDRGKDTDGDAFEIPMQGAALFACRKDAWLGFNPRFNGFGGEEGYIHEKFRQAGHRTLCLPFLRWMHRFNRPAGVPYPINWKARIRNYMIGATELKLNQEPISEHFNEHLGVNHTQKIVEEVQEELKNPFMFFDAIYCINLEIKRDRWLKMQKRFEILGIDHRVVRIEGIYTPDNHHLGCALSHREIIHQAQYHNYENILVFEDDALFLNSTLEHLEKALSELKKLEWELFYLGAHYYRSKLINRELKEFTFLQSAKNTTCTHSVAYHRRSYKTILKDIPEDFGKLRKWRSKNKAIDQYLTKRFKKIYLCQPEITAQQVLIKSAADRNQVRTEDYF